MVVFGYITMNIEETFTKNVQWVLNEIQTELIVENAKTIRFRFGTGEGVPTERDQGRICRWLIGLGIVKHIEDINAKLPFSLGYPFIGALVGYVLEVDEVLINELASIYNVEIRHHTNHKTLLANARKLKKVTKVVLHATNEEQKQLPVFSEENREIYFKGKACDVPVGNQFEVAKSLFSATLGTWVTETEVVGRFSKGDNKQSFYDAQRYLNERICKKLGIDNLIEYKGSAVRLDPKLIEKLGQA